MAQQEKCPTLWNGDFLLFFWLRASLPKILFPGRAFFINQNTFPEHIYRIRLNSQRYSLFTETYFSNLHAFNTPTHLPKKLAHFLLQQIAAPPNYYFHYLEVLQGVARCFNKNFWWMCFDQCVATSHIHQIATPPNYYFYYLVLQGVATKNGLAYFFEK